MAPRSSRPPSPASATATRARDAELRAQLVSILASGHSHASFDEVVDRFPMSAINRRLPRVPYTFWHLVEHIRLTQRDMLDYMRDPGYQAPPWPAGYWPARTERATPARWRQSIEQFRTDLRAVLALVRDRSRDLFATAPTSGGKHTFVRCALVIGDHNAYHVGELGIGRQIADLWPPHHGDD
jgi:DinB family protein